MTSQGYMRHISDSNDILDDYEGFPTPPSSGVNIIFKAGYLARLRPTVEHKILILVGSVTFFLLLLLSILLTNSRSAVEDLRLQLEEQKKTEDFGMKSGGGEVCISGDCVFTASRILSSMDLSVNPCQDFYSFACRGWITSNPIPSGHSQWERFSKLWMQNQLVMKNAIEVPELSLVNEAERKAKRFYLSCLDAEGTIEELGGQPLVDLMQNFKVRLSQPTAPDEGWLFQDMLEKVDNAGLGLPKRDFYINKTVDDDKVLSAYLRYMVSVNELLDPGSQTDFTQHLRDVVAFETRLAEITTPDEDRRDKMKNYHKMAISEMQKEFPLVDWLTFLNSLLSLSGIVLDSSEQVVVYQVDYMRNLTKLLDDTLRTFEGRRTLNLYLEWHVVQPTVSLLSKPFRDAELEFSRQLTGAMGREARWRQCISGTDRVLGLALGAMFVRNAFSGESKERVERMVAEVRASFMDSFPHRSWMDERTSWLATEKAKAIVDLIGYPAYILNNTRMEKDYEELLISESEYFENNMRHMKYALRNMLKKLRRPPHRDESLNFGAIGVVIGHELTHGFDDQGREYDKDGNLRSWWNDDVTERFRSRSQCMVDQYSSYTLNGERVRGKQTLGENIADNGGLKSAFRAYREWVRINGEERHLPALNMTHEQLFFLSFAQVWCSTSTKQADHLSIVSDPHTPSRFRVIGTLSNSPHFAEHWKCPMGSAMNPQTKCEVW